MEEYPMESIVRLREQANRLEEPSAELKALEQRLCAESERFLASIAGSVGGRSLQFSMGPLVFEIRKSANGQTCEYRIQESDEELNELISTRGFDAGTAAGIFILSHREDILQSCSEALEDHRHMLQENIDHIRSLLP